MTDANNMRYYSVWALLKSEMERSNVHNQICPYRTATPTSTGANRSADGGSSTKSNAQQKSQYDMELRYFGKLDIQMQDF